MSHKIAIIGLGYVGLPLAVEFVKKYQVVGFDINQDRVHELNQGHDSTLEVNDHELSKVLDVNEKVGLKLSCDVNDIKDSNIYIVTVPTPVDRNKRPILTPLVKASETVGKILKQNDIVIYESTVYPGVTEDECVPVLEKYSGLKFNVDFFCGYSPERINPGDKKHTVANIKKVTSGSTPKIGKIVDDLYKSIITAGTHLAPTLKVAEASKVIENAQRDVNIAFVNELAIIFNKLGIDTHDVLEAAATKWNFLPFKPGLVGGHCIGVDPFYLAKKAQEAGYYSEIILAARRLNDSMAEFVATEILKLMVKNNINPNAANILMLGFTFKENCSDIRNTKAIDLYNSLSQYNSIVHVYDPKANREEVKSCYDIELLPELVKFYDVIILVVGHSEFLELDLGKLRTENSFVYDVKGILPKNIIENRL
ncbi:MAG: nucleotide sugar dehydrogenase [Winogradskyella sp.]|uniref:nucleotide sugar dehydrogenase n=1 Tax=Winogradskyella sp. TaxID=1883156 RepID=UPI0017F6A1B4|nr:nucleotide sugar dehydrogenase [Winogradskyella sp.]MBT8243795.1 nucleotide sugar dehydrogenase [Winogradskyella sp.]NNK23403.1 nucleotide sugar dehydrogenase [Winogradskyella sp.]